MHRVTTVVQGSHLVRRLGSYRHEFLLQRGLMKVRQPDGRYALAVQFCPPKGLQYGRKAGHFFTAHCEFLGLPRALGHTGPVFNVGLWDGHMVKAHTRFMHGRHELYYKSLEGIVDKDDIFALKVSEFNIAIRCKVHAANLGPDWGSRPWQGPDVLDGSFQVIRSLKNCSSAIHSLTEEFIIRRHRFRDIEHQAPREAVHEFWAWLKIPPRFLQLFCEVDPLWDPTQRRLDVNSRLRDDPEAWQKISVVVFFCRRWKLWSLTRWVRGGDSGRLALRSFLTGVDFQIQQCRDDEAINEENLAGFRRCSPAVVLFLSIMAISFQAIEFLILQLLEDDRLLVHAARLLPRMFEIMGDTAALSTLTWERLAGAAGVSMYVMRHSVLYAMVSGIAVAWRDVFLDLEELPLSLTQGDIAGKVNRLVNAGDRIDNPVARRMRSFADLSSEEALVSALQDLKQIPMSTTLCEQGHGPGKLLLRNHHLLTEKQLRVGAQLMALRVIVRRRKQTTMSKRVGRLLLELSKKAAAPCERQGDADEIHGTRAPASCPRPPGQAKDNQRGDGGSGRRVSRFAIVAESTLVVCGETAWS